MPGRISCSSARWISAARSASSSEMSPVTEISRMPFSRRTVLKPVRRSTLTMSLSGT